MLVWSLALMLGFSPVGSPQAAAPTAIRRADLRSITLRYTPQGNPQTVSVAGQFNGWNKQANPMAKQADGKTWQITLSLEPGAYQYKFVVNGDTWIPDPTAPTVDDGNGNVNSLLTITPPDFDRLPGVSGDDRITESAVRHEATARYIRRPDPTHLTLFLRTRLHDVQRCSLILHPGGRTPALPIHMTVASSDALYDTWRVTIPAAVQKPMEYAFLLEDGPHPQRYDATGLHASPASPAWFTVNPADYPALETPEWPRDAVFYQIFPDRFADGDTSNDPADVQPWGSKPNGVNWMGGDLVGVQKHMDYLRDLGIDALYFNPIFAARSNHAYDTTDYLQVDPRFGTNQNLIDLVAKAHTLGWHVILDGVFNHTGIDFHAFQTLRTDREKSPYRDWYFIHGFPLEVRDGQTNYVGWFGNPWMPKLNVNNPETRDYLLHVATNWISEAKIDGWRLDAADEVDHAYWKQFRATVKQTNPNAYVVGEIWGNASDWLQGDQFDSVMNYRWRDAALNFFALDKTTPTQFDQQLAKIRDDYPKAATDVMFNILDSHDTERLRTTCNNDWTRERQAVLFQMTYPGTPCIYYGDEIGMEGGHDPDDRRAMPWNPAQWDQTTHNFYKQVVKLRNTRPVLRHGDYKTLLEQDDTGVFGFVRTLQRQRAIVLFNRSDRSQQITLKPEQLGNAPLTDWLTGARVKPSGTELTLSLPPRGIALLGTSLPQ